MLSATTLVSNESIAPSRARINAVSTYGPRFDTCGQENIPQWMEGSPASICEMLRQSRSRNSAALVMATNATNALGIAVVMRLNP